MQSTFFLLWAKELTPGFEDNVIIDGVETEIEKEWYVKVPSPGSSLKKIASDIEHHEQWQFKALRNGATMRVRKTTIDTNTTYELTIKSGRNEDGSRSEANMDTTEQVFDEFRKSFADNGMIKTRYSIPFEINGTQLKWEVDVYPGTDWVKVDLEVPSASFTVKPEFPFGAERVIAGGKNDTRTPEEWAGGFGNIFMGLFMKKMHVSDLKLARYNIKLSLT